MILSSRGVPFPFAAIVGQENVKLALMIAAVDPSIGGVLISGPKGTGKSIIVRGFAELLPKLKRFKDCPYGCDPDDAHNACPDCNQAIEKKAALEEVEVPMEIVQVPVGTTEERILGALDFEEALKGNKCLDPGLLARAHRNFLYIDNVNLLPDHLIDCILDSSVSGWNILEREGMKLEHPARFTLIGTMIWEEGDLRPQILDRFGIHAQTDTVQTLKERALLIERVERFQKNPEDLRKEFQEETNLLRDRIQRARNHLNRVKISDEALRKISQICANLKVDGHRPDIVMTRAAQALAALDGREEIADRDIGIAADLALTHRTRFSGFYPPAAVKEIQQTVKTVFDRTVAAKRTGIAKGVATIKAAPIQVTMAVRRVPFREVAVMIFAFFFLPIILFYLTGLLFFVEYYAVTGHSWAVAGELAKYPALIFALIASAMSFLYLARQRRRSIMILRPTFERLARLFIDEQTLTQAGAKKTQLELPDSQTVPLHVVSKLGKIETVLDYGQKISQDSLDSVKPPSDLTFESLARSFTKRLHGSRGSVARGALKSVSSQNPGRYVWYEPARETPWDVAISPTIRSAARHSRLRRRPGVAVEILPEDVQVKVKEYRSPLSVTVLLDMSESMISSLDNVAKAILSLHKSAYRRRDRVGLIVFKGSKAIVLQKPTSNLNLVISRLFTVGASNFTPLPAGLRRGLEVLMDQVRRNRDLVPVLIVITDGIVNVPLDEPISLRSRRTYMNSAQGDAIDLARKLANANIRTVFINTDHRENEKLPFVFGRHVELKPTAFLIELAKITRGRYYGLETVRLPAR
jgi:Mg-chelatase subunit ChlI/Mg-chelatase subunit ChlD